MTAEEVVALVVRELGTAEFQNLHGLTRANIDRYLVTPTYESYEQPGQPDQVVQHWTILHEDPSGNGGLHGYTIFYSQDAGMFGLAVPGASAKYTIVGLYGSLLRTLTAM